MAALRSAALLSDLIRFDGYDVSDVRVCEYHNAAGAVQWLGSLLKLHLLHDIKTQLVINIPLPQSRACAIG